MKLFTFISVLRGRVRIRTIATAIVLIGVLVTTAIALTYSQPTELTDSPETVHVLREGDKGITLFGVITPYGNGFGDRALATVVVWLDTTKINKDRISLEQINLSPYTEMGNSELSVEQFEDVARVTYSIELRCLEVECLNVDGTPVTSRLDRVYIRYEMWELRPDGVPRVAYKGGEWSTSAVVGRIDPEGLGSYVFDGDTTPPDPVFSVSWKAQRTLVLLGAGIFGIALMFLLNPQIRLWPEHEEPQVALARLKKTLKGRQKSEYDRLHDAVEAARAVRGTASADMYHLALALEEVGETGLAERARRLHFVPGRGEALRREMLDDISRILGEVAHG